MLLQHRGGVGGERRSPTVQGERLGVRHQPAQGLERVEEAVSPREEVHVGVVVVVVLVGAGQRGRVEAPGRTALQHACLVVVVVEALVLQHYGDAGQRHRHDSSEVGHRFRWRVVPSGERGGGGRVIKV